MGQGGPAFDETLSTKSAGGARGVSRCDDDRDGGLKERVEMMKLIGIDQSCGRRFIEIMLNALGEAVGGLTAPITKLVEVVAQGIGAVYEPHKVIKLAEANAAASLILAKGDIAKYELFQRAAARLAYVEADRQANIETIVERAKLALPPTVSSSPVDRDWINSFFSSCQDISDSELQEIWARVLSNEVTSPGTIPKRTLEFLRSFERQEADLFESLMSVSISGQGNLILVLDSEATSSALDKLNPEVDVRGHLIDIGLLGSEEHLLGASKINWQFEYCGDKFTLRGPPPPARLGLEKSLSIRRLTATGCALAKVAKCKPIPGYVQSLSEDLGKRLKVTIEPLS